MMQFTNKKKSFFVTILIALISVAVGYFLIAKNHSAKAKKELSLAINQFSKYAEQSRKSWKIPGMAVAIVKDDKVIFAQGYGVTHLASKHPVTPNTVFGIGSCSKAFTSVLLAKLVDEGKLRWNTKVAQLLPSLKFYDPLTTKNLEIRDLVAHDSGLPKHALDGQAYLGFSQDQIVHSLRYIKPISKFRTAFAYQNSMLLVAAKVIKKVTGKSFAQNLKEQIFYPLNMKNSGTDSTIFNQNHPNIAHPYVFYHGKMRTVPKGWSYYYWMNTYLPAGGIASNVLDMAQWLIFHMDHGNYQNRQIISTKNLDFTHRPQTLIAKTEQGSYSYGEGWFIDPISHKPYSTIWHDGGVTGMHSVIAFIPQLKLGIVILTNASNQTLPEVLAGAFFQFYFRKPFQDNAKIVLQQQLNSEKEKEQKQQQGYAPQKNVPIQKYTGTYHNEIYGDIDISAENHHLTVVIGPKKIKWQLIPWNKNKFKLVWKSGIPEIEPDGGFVTFDDEGKQVTIDFLNKDGAGRFKKYNLVRGATK